MADVAVAVDVWVDKDVVADEEAVAGPSGGKTPKNATALPRICCRLAKSIS